MGQLYGGRWEVQESLGEGGQAHTFVVIDRKGQGETHYVLKRLKNAKRIARFKREIEAVRNLAHENIVRLTDFDVDGERPFLVMEYCNGGNLEDTNPFWKDSPIKALEIFQQVCEGVAHAHSHKVIHRDIKPANIFLRGKAGPAVVGDFGICFIEEDGTRFTVTDEAVGPRNFIAPELEDGRLEAISDKSDVYSLGKLLYWLLSGGRMFSREKYRDPEWDLKERNEDTLLGWNNIYMEHVNRLLDYMIVADPSKRRSVQRILPVAREVTRLVQKEFNPISRNIRQLCTYCGQGSYVLRGHETTDVHNFGFSPVSGSEWRIFTCNTCGHVQVFRIESIHRKDWWQGIP
jgi:serine/threonine protein kinase